jgi:hypothetical protein
MNAYKAPDAVEVKRHAVLTITLDEVRGHFHAPTAYFSFEAKTSVSTE